MSLTAHPALFGSVWLSVSESGRESGVPLCGICCSQALWGTQSLQHYGMQSQKSPKLCSFAQGDWAQDSCWKKLYWPLPVPIQCKTAGELWGTLFHISSKLVHENLSWIKYAFYFGKFDNRLLLTLLLCRNVCPVSLMGYCFSWRQLHNNWTQKHICEILLPLLLTNDFYCLISCIVCSQNTLGSISRHSAQKSPSYCIIIPYCFNIWIRFRC